MASSRMAEIALPEDRPPLVGFLIAELVAKYPELARRIYREPGVLRPGVNVFVGRENARFMDGMETAVASGQEVWIITPESGG